MILVKASIQTLWIKVVNFSILSYNIQAGRNARDKYDLGRTIKTIKKSQAEIIGLNEVDRNWSARSNWDDQPKIISGKFEASSVFAASLDEPPTKEGRLWRQFGNLLLCQYPILENKVEKMNIAGTSTVSPGDRRNTETRTLILAKINLWEVEIWVLCTHLTPHDQQKDRLEQIAKIEKIIGILEGPLVLIGDLNASPDCEELTRLRKLLNDPSEGKGFVTKPDEGRQIDYILVRDLKVEEIKVLDSDTSDHLPIFAKISR